MNKQDESYKSFLDEIRRLTAEKLGGEYTVSLASTLKNNSVMLDSINISKDSEAIMPCIYLDDYFREYLKGRPAEDIAGDVVLTYFDNKDRIDMSMIGDCSFEDMKEKIFLKLVNRKMNGKLLEQMPHVDDGDFAIIFACLVEHEKSLVSSIRIDNQVAAKWNTDAEELLSIAMENTVRLFPPRVFEMNCENLFRLFKHEELGDNLTDIFEQDTSETDNTEKTGKEDENDPPRLYVLTNRYMINGAGCLTYEGLLERIYRKLGSGFYIIPSSVHEVLILPDDPRFDEDSLKSMVNDVNTTVVSDMEILSYEVYHYPGYEFVPSRAIA